MKKYKYVIMLVIVILISVLVLFLLSNHKKKKLWEICNPQSTDCRYGSVCKQVGDSNQYRCVKYLRKGRRCGTDVAKICGKGLTCTDTNKIRERCGTFTTTRDKECLIEPIKMCK
ncbi:MAG: hypothetical protein ACOX06_03220 [Candidatus Dojkabacteria bacterium]